MSAPRITDHEAHETMIKQLEAMLQRGQDSALLRFSLGGAYLKDEDPQAALTHLAEAVRLDPGYSAAWKLYGKTLVALARFQEAIEAFEQGIAVAETKGDIQAAKEMRVFHKRALKDMHASDTKPPTPSSDAT
ncbi:MAG: tetratricopeptide repeat protein [Sphingobacteriia bacterium]|nr:tetratricopeptide repeat protein [Sphingobacteriia bacterium]NCC39831.1 tetratricopeptide repeat protein [Gammaproteobacteria bacterium]